MADRLSLQLLRKVTRKRNFSADKKLPAHINQKHIRPVPESHIACYTYKICLNLGNLKKEEEKKEVAGYPENPEKERRKQRKLKTILLIR